MIAVTILLMGIAIGLAIGLAFGASMTRRRHRRPGRPITPQPPAPRAPIDLLAARYGHPDYLTEDQKRAAIQAVAQETMPPAPNVHY